MADYDRPHIDIAPFLTTSSYTAHQSPGGRTFTRNRDQHGPRLSAGLVASLTAAEARRPAPDTLPHGVQPGEGAFVTVILDPNARELDLEKPKKGVRQSAAGEANGRRTMVLHMADEDAQAYLRERVERYLTGELNDRERPPLYSEMEPIDGFSPTELLDLWREDPGTLPTDANGPTWWGLWCWDDFVDDVTGVARALKMHVAPEDRWSTFPDVRVVPVHATRAQVQTMLDLNQSGLAEIGYATDDPAILIDLTGQEQDGLVEDLAGRIQWPGADVPAICLLDTGVNRAHPLIEPALTSDDAQAVDPDWGSDDHHRPGHGTPMAGLALHGDLTGPLAHAARRRRSGELWRDHESGGGSGRGSESRSTADNLLGRHER
ncbi:S8 family serine peptidase [Limimaricola cinnabarinus]|uniref:S8 family serine peptidase n=1 Tax=Limimaricola cinnabarinus TaxID=1125964 RepID=UPI00248FD0B9|nr:S8 family serine peptidase [Limimaricola cinnabarinus]